VIGLMPTGLQASNFGVCDALVLPTSHRGKRGSSLSWTARQRMRRWYADAGGSVVAAMDPSSALVERVDAVFADLDMPEQPGGAALLVIDHDEIVY
jgi:hypothetical protein